MEDLILQIEALEEAIKEQINKIEQLQSL